MMGDRRTVRWASVEWKIGRGQPSASQVLTSFCEKNRVTEIQQVVKVYDTELLLAYKSAPDDDAS